MRRRTELRSTRGTTWPPEVRQAAWDRDHGCIGPRAGMPDLCLGTTELDHVRASGGMSMKSRSTLDNAAHLCARHHDMKTRDGKKWRPVLLEWIDRKARVAATLALDCTHVEPVFGCRPCGYRKRVPS